MTDRQEFCRSGEVYARFNGLGVIAIRHDRQARDYCHIVSTSREDDSASALDEVRLRMERCALEYETDLARISAPQPMEKNQE